MRKMTIPFIALAAMVAAPVAFSQEWRSQQQGSQSGAAEPPGGAYRGYLDSRDVPEQQQAQVPSESQTGRVDPGTLRRFNSNSGYGPEVQFDVDRREAAERARAQRGQSPLR